MRTTPRRTQLRLGPVVIALAAGALVVLSGMAVNGCRIGKLLSSSNTPAASGGGVIIVVPSVVRDSAIAGTSATRVTDVAVSNGGRWGASTDDPWIDVSPPSGGSRATLKVSLDPKGLAPGLHRGAVTLQEHDNEDTRATVSVNFLIQQPVLEIEPKEFNFRPNNSNTVYHDTIYVTNEGTGPLVWSATTERHAGWLKFESDTSGTAPSAIAIRASNAGLSYFGTYRETIIVSSPGAKGSPKEIEVTMRRKRGGDDDDSGTP
jgi:Viral BACON domain